MKKISLVAFASLIALSGVAGAQSFDINAMPLSSIPTATDNTATGSIGAPVKKRVVVRDGVKVTQLFTVDQNGDLNIVSEKANQ